MPSRNKTWCAQGLPSGDRPRVCQNVARYLADGMPVCGLHAKFLLKQGHTIVPMTEADR